MQPSRISRGGIIAQLRLAARKGDRAALTLAVDQMKTWAYSPRYWQKYLQLLTHPLARLVDLALIKQGERIAHQKGWAKARRQRAPAGRGPSTKTKKRGPRPAGRVHRPGPEQPWLFPEPSG